MHSQKERSMISHAPFFFYLFFIIYCSSVTDLKILFFGTTMKISTTLLYLFLTVYNLQTMCMEQPRKLTVAENQLIRAASTGDLIQVQELVNKVKVNTNVQDLNGTTPLHRAIYFNQLDIIVYLTQHGANPLLCDDKNETPLDVAHQQHPNLVPLLELHSLLQLTKNNKIKRTLSRSIVQCLPK